MQFNHFFNRLQLNYLCFDKKSLYIKDASYNNEPQKNLIKTTMLIRTKKRNDLVLKFYNKFDLAIDEGHRQQQ